MSTPSEREAALRRALLSAAEQIEPAPGGLERIQARLGRPRPLPVAWLEAAWTVLTMRSPDVIEAVRRRLAMVLGLAWERFGPRSASGPGPGSRLRWLRPLVAMSVAVFVIGSGIYIGLASPAAIFNTNGVTINGGDGGTHPGGAGHSGHGATYGNGSLPASPAPNSSGGSAACKKPRPRYESAPSTSPSPTSPATSPSQSTSPSPSPSDSASPNPSSSPPSSGGSAATPAAGLPGVIAGNAVSGTGGSKSGTSGKSARNGALSASATQSPVAGGPSLPSSNSPKYNPCPNRKRRHHGKTTTLASAAGPMSVQLSQTQPGEAVAVKLD